MLNVLLSLLLHQEHPTLFEALEGYLTWPKFEVQTKPFFAIINSDTNDEPAQIDWNIGLLSQEMFRFGCGGRFFGLWKSWGPVTDDDRIHVVGIEAVQKHCVQWPLENPNEFSKLCNVLCRVAHVPEISSVRKEWEKIKRAENSSEHAEVELSGAVDLTGLPPKKSAR